MQTATANRLLPVLIAEMEHANQVQEEVNMCYEKLSYLILCEAENSMKGKGTRRKLTKHKEYWDPELTRLWRIMKNCEHEYRKSCKNRSKNTALKQSNFKKL